MEDELLLGRSYERRCKKPLPPNIRISTIGSVWSGRGSDLKDFIYEFNSTCLAARDLDELTKTVLFIDGLLDMEVVKRGERCHPKTLQEAISVARTAARNRNSVPSGQLRQMHT